MKLNLRKSLWIGGGIALLLIVLISATSFVMYQRQNEMAKMVSHTYEVLTKIKDVQNVVDDLVTSRRGYRSTNDTGMLWKYHQGLKQVVPNQAELCQLVSDNAEQMANCNNLKKKLDTVIAYWNTLPVYDRAFPIEEKLRITQMEETLMADVNIAFDSLVAHEKRLLDKRTDANRDLAGMVLLLLVIGVIVTLAIVVVMIMVIRREFERRRQYQQHLKKNNKDLQMTLQERKQINAQLERFTYVVAHDLKSPIAGSMALVNFLAEDERINQYEDLKELTGMFHETMHKLSDRIASVLEYSRTAGKQQQVEQVDTHKLVKNIKEILFHPKNIDISISENLPVITANEAKLQQVFQNLMSNAVKYNDKPRGLIEVGVTKSADHYQFFVKDNGPGIKEEDKERIFNLYEVTDNEAHGENSTGIGLNLLKTLIEEQDGRIWVESNKGSGATFFFTWKKASA